MNFEAEREEKVEDVGEARRINRCARRYRELIMIEGGRRMYSNRPGCSLTENLY